MGMNIPAGYKQTEVGVIPEDWNLKTFGQVLSICHGKSQRDVEVADGPYPILASGGKIGTAKAPLYEHDSVLIGRKGTINKPQFMNSPFWTVDTLFYSKINVGNSAKFIYYLFCSIDWMQYNEASGVPSLNARTIEAIKRGYPLNPEQQAIATALSDTDALIESLAQLIAKKRQIKQGAMQELLTGQRRLPGFCGEWEVKQLGDVIERFVGGGTPSRAIPHYWGEEIPWVTVKDFATFSSHQAQESITKVGLRNSASNLIAKGTLITSTRMALGKAVIYEVDVAINQDLKALFPKHILDTNYLLFWFQYHGQSIDGLGSGSTVKGISLPDIKKIEFLLPSNSEQTAIATILSDMDTELTALQNRLTKARHIKQGMMQELLTGRIRLL